LGRSRSLYIDVLNRRRPTLVEESVL